MYLLLKCKMSVQRQCCSSVFPTGPLSINVLRSFIPPDHYTPSCQVADYCNISFALFLQQDTTKCSYCTLLTYVSFFHRGKTCVFITIFILLNSAFNLPLLYGNYFPSGFESFSFYILKLYEALYFVGDLKFGSSFSRLSCMGM